MDSLTQAVLGASMAHACWHRQIGKKSLVIGAGLGTLPDLDVIISPLLNDIQRLYWHRGESHSIFFILLGSLAGAWLFKNYFFCEKLSFKRSYLGFFLVFATHISIDFFTIYGTQILAPFSRYGFAYGNFFIIDPLYTLPLTAGVLVSGFSSGKGYRANYTGIGISCIYLCFSFWSHSYADRIFKAQLDNKGIEVLNSFTGATPLNTLLWRHVARTDKGILIGYFSVIGKNSDKEIKFDFVPRNDDLIEPFNNQVNVKAVKWFSKGFYTASRENNKIILSDIRFGEFRFKIEDSYDKWKYFFVWEITDDQEKLTQLKPDIGDIKPAVKILLERLKGEY